MVRAASRERLIPWLLFAATFIAFAYFYQGGGWNQNVRFAMIRAMVEEKTFSLDSYLMYIGLDTGTGLRLARVPVQNAQFTYGGRNYAFHWPSADGRMIPLNVPVNKKDKDVTYVEPDEVAISGDLAFYNGHFYPAKAPGGAFIAVPAYFLLYHVEHALGADPDEWCMLTLNAWLTSVFSVGLLSALGCVILYDLSLKLSGGRSRESLLAALTLAFGTMYFSYSTMLYGHNIVAVALLACFALLHRVKESAASPSQALSTNQARLYLLSAGLCAGYAAITNYLMAMVVILMGCYLLLGVRWKGGWLWFGIGVLVPLLLILSYNVACFSTPFTTNYSHENPVFKTGTNAFLGVFLPPQMDVLLMVLFSPYRGLFFTAPVLLFGLYSLLLWTRDPKLKAEAWLIISMVLFFLLFIVTFNGWHGGWAVGPRYLIPVLPFLALPLTSAFTRFFKTVCTIAVISLAVNLLVVAVDPQAPVGNARSAMVEGRAQWKYNPLIEYELPLFCEGRAGPLLRAQRNSVLRYYDEAMREDEVPVELRSQRLDQLRNEIDGDIRSGRPAPLLLAQGLDGRPALIRSELSTITGPVSVNPFGVYEGWMYRIFPPQSAQVRKNSFNAGEFLFEGSRWSLMPLLFITGSLVSVMILFTPRSDPVRKTGGQGEKQLKA
jgi:hypothetical protein